jgi:hypothetical protein
MLHEPAADVPSSLALESHFRADSVYADCISSDTLPVQVACLS